MVRKVKSGQTEKADWDSWDSLDTHPKIVESETPYRTFGKGVPTIPTIPVWWNTAYLTSGMV